MGHEHGVVNLPLLFLVQQVEHAVRLVLGVTKASEEVFHLLARDLAQPLQIQRTECIPDVLELDVELVAHVLHHPPQLCPLVEVHVPGPLLAHRSATRRHRLGLLRSVRLHEVVLLLPLKAFNLHLVRVGLEAVVELLQGNLTGAVRVNGIVELSRQILREVAEPEKELRLILRHAAVSVQVNVAEGICQAAEAVQRLLRQQPQRLLKLRVKLVQHVLPVFIGFQHVFQHRVRCTSAARQVSRRQGRPIDGPLQEWPNEVDKPRIIQLSASLLVQKIEELVCNDVGKVVAAEKMAHLAAVDVAVTVRVEVVESSPNRVELLLRSLLADELKDQLHLPLLLVERLEELLVRAARLVQLPRREGPGGSNEPPHWKIHPPELLQGHSSLQ
mmetsp:Transcript_55876/g.104839  ORF Transcript_55876/g.104839 Transcript_55876/m.104839 type:complete len:387 (-) Transcript_55876:188-1348(-)